MDPKNESNKVSTTDDNDSDYYEEEELYIYADFQNNLPFETLIDPNLKIKIIGIDTTEPIFQINSKMFEGSFDYAMGTELFFQESTNDNLTGNDNNLYQTIPNQPYEYINKTNKILKMNRIFVEANDESSTDMGGAGVGGGGIQNDVAIIIKSENSEPPIVLTKSYSEALDQLLKPGEPAPRSLDEEDEAFFRKYSQIDDEQITATSDNNENIDRTGEVVGSGDDDETMPSVSSLNLSNKN